MAQLQKGYWIELSNDIQSRKDHDRGWNDKASNKRGNRLAAFNRGPLAGRLKVHEVNSLKELSIAGHSQVT